MADALIRGRGRYQWSFPGEPGLLRLGEVGASILAQSPRDRNPRWRATATRARAILAAQQIAPEVRRILRGHEYSEDRGGEIASRTLADDDEVLDAPARIFGLHFPAGTRSRPRQHAG